MVITLTCHPTDTWETVAQKLKDATPSLNRIFPDGLIRVIDFMNSGVLHIHLLAITPEDVATGFDWDSYMELHKLSRQRRAAPLSPEDRQHRSRLGRLATGNPHLRALRRQVREVVTHHGFARRLEVTPIRVSADAVGRYFVRNYFRCVRNPRRPRHAKVMGYIGPFPRIEQTGPTSGQLLYWRKRDVVLQAIQMDQESMAHHFGSRWQVRLMRAMGILDELQIASGPEPDNWQEDVIRRIAERHFKYCFPIAP